MKGKFNRIENLISGRNNNLNFIRFVAAALVIFSHSYPLSTGSSGNEPLSLLTGGDATLGKMAVSIFFVISGFLITMSYDRSKDAFLFLKSRILRIFPGLMFALVVTSLLIGALSTSLSLVDYYSNIDTYKYLLNIVLKSVSNTLPGVFEQNVYGTSINGSLWTLEYEFVFYLVVLFLGVTRMLNKYIVVLGFVLTFGIYFIQLPEAIKSGIELFSFFSSGMLLYLFRSSIPIGNRLAVASLLGLAVSIYVGMFVEAFAVCGSYLIIYCAYQKNKYLMNFSKYGDFSYGLYIFAFPVQQLITQYNGGTMKPMINFIIAFPITLIFAISSWHLIEKMALRKKKSASIAKHKTYPMNISGDPVKGRI